MTAHKMAHKMAHKNPHALVPEVRDVRRALADCSLSAFGRRLRQGTSRCHGLPQMAAGWWWRDVARVAGSAYCWARTGSARCR